MSLWSSLQKKLAKSTVKAQMKSMPSQLFSIPFHGVLLRLDSWFLNAWGEQEKIRESSDTSNRRSSSANLVPHLQTNPITVSPVLFLRLNNNHTTTSLCSSQHLIKNCLCHKNCKGLDNIYTAGCAESKGIEIPEVKKHN